jgi:hypothetical protein
MSDQAGGTWIASGKSNKIFVSTGRASLDINKVMVFDSLGTKLSSFTFSDYPCAMAFNETKQLLYVVGYNATRGSILHVVDASNTEKANYKIRSNDQTIAIGLEKNGDVVLAFKEESKVLKIKPLFQ